MGRVSEFTTPNEERSHEESPALARALAWVIQNVTTTMTLVGLGCYLLFQTCQRLYYENFKVTLEDLGVSYSRILTNDGGLTLAGMLIGVLIVLLIFKKTAADSLRVIRVYRTRSSELEFEIASAKSTPDRNPTTLESLEKEFAAQNRHRIACESDLKRTHGRAFGCLVVLILLWALFVIAQATRADDGIRRPRWWDPLQTRAVPATVLWVGPSGPDTVPRTLDAATLGQDPAKPMSLLYLGSSGGRLVLYNTVTKAPFTVDAPKVLLRLS